MARKRMEEPALKSWEEADSTLKQIREAEIELSRIAADAERCMIDIRQQAEDRAQPYKDRIKQMELQLKEFTVTNKADLKGKTREMAFGRVGFRMSTRLVLQKALEPVITALRKNGMGDCVVIKESVNKEILKTYDENTILSVGGSLKKEDTFWYETKQEKVAEPS